MEVLHRFLSSSNQSHSFCMGLISGSINPSVSSHQSSSVVENLNALCAQLLNHFLRRYPVCKLSLRVK